MLVTDEVLLLVGREHPQNTPPICIHTLQIHNIPAGGPISQFSQPEETAQKQKQLRGSVL